MKLSKIVFLKNRYNRIYTVPSNATVLDTAKKLVECNAGALLVHEPGCNPMKYIGIVSERDIVRRLCADNGDIRNLKVSEIMTKDMIVADINDDVDYVMHVMTNKKIRHIPVLENSKIIALLSNRHIIEALHEDDEIKIRHLSDYVSGNRGNQVF